MFNMTFTHLTVIIRLKFLFIVFQQLSLTTSAPSSVCYSDFEFKAKESVFVDKSLFLKELFVDSGHKVVITAPNGFGKTSLLQMVKAFLQVDVDKHGKRISMVTDKSRVLHDTPNYKLFQQLKIKNYPDLMTKYFGKYPVIYLDYKSVMSFSHFNQTEDFFKEILHECYMEHGYLEKSDKLYDDEKDFVKAMCSDDYKKEEVGSLIPGIEKLSKFLFKHFDRSKVVVLVDHYDSPIYNCMFDSECPLDVFKYLINIILMLLEIKQDSFYIDTFLIMGVSQLKEPHFQSDKIIKRYQFLDEHRFVPFFGFLEDEVFDVLGRYTIDVDSNILENVQSNYGGYTSMSNITVLNIWALRQYLHKQKLEHFWAKNQDIPNMKSLVKIPDIRDKLEAMLKDLPRAMELKRTLTFDNLMILKDLLNDPIKKEHLLYTKLFYTLMFEHGFLTCDPSVKSAISDARRYLLPNEEVKEFYRKALNGS